MFTETFQFPVKIFVPVVDGDLLTSCDISRSSECIEAGRLHACALMFKYIPELKR